MRMEYIKRMLVILFYDELRNIDDETDTKNWTQESMHTLEGGKTAFYDRKDIYESGKQSD